MKELSIAFQMDELSQINFDTDTTIRLIWEAKRRNYNIYYYTPKDLLLENGIVYAHLYNIEIDPENTKVCSISYFKKVDLSIMDIIFIRQNPPFDMPYLTSTYLLEKIKNKTKIINNPTEIRNSPEKLLVCNFPELMPATLITSNISDIKNFLNQYKKIVLKPLYAYGGRDVFVVKKNDENFLPIYEHLISKYNDLIIAQQFLEEIKAGDKRIILINGEPSYAILRVPQTNQIRSNIAIGGIAVKTNLTARDLFICQTISKELKERQLYLTGIDVIGNYLTEINVTSPTGVAVINKLYNIKLEKIILDNII